MQQSSFLAVALVLVLSTAASAQQAQCRTGGDGAVACGFACRVGGDGAAVCADSPDGACGVSVNGKVVCTSSSVEHRAVQPQPWAER